GRGPASSAGDRQGRWIPACAGMTGVRSVFRGVAKDCRGYVVAALLALVCAIAPYATTAHAADTPDMPVLQLTVHEQQPMRLPGNLERMAIADPSVADVVNLHHGNNVLLVGKKPGRTTLLMWLRGQSQPVRYELDVRSAVQAQLLGKQSAGNTQLTIQDGSRVITGSAPSLLDHQQTAKAATAGGAGKQPPLDASTIATSPVVQVDVKVVEINKTALRQVGINFTKTNGNFQWGFAQSGTGGGGSGGGTSAVSSAFNLIYNRASNLFASIKLMEDNGMARVLAEPSLVALSGQSASFLAGGELPIPQPQGLGTTSIV